MSVYIKYFSKPQECRKCVFSYMSLVGKRCMATGELISKEAVNEDCPIVEVEPHGRPIDADKLISDLVPDPILEMGCPEPDYLDSLMWVLEECPAVIEAD